MEKKISQNYTVAAWGWDGIRLLVLTGEMLATVQVDGAHKRPGHGYLKMD